MAARWAQRSRPCAGETANGDLALALSEGSRHAFIAIDALGHGPRAEEAALIAAEALRSASLADGIEALFAETHRALRGSRGVAMTVALQEGDILRVAGVGNVMLRLLSDSSLALVPTDGVLGRRSRRLRVVEGRVPSGRLVLHTDGISRRFDAALLRDGSPDEACERLLASHGASHDDATVLIADL